MVSVQALNHWASLRRQPLSASPRILLRKSKGLPSSSQITLAQNVQNTGAMSGDAVGDFFQGLETAVAGLFDAIGAALDAIAQTIGNIIALVINVVGFALGMVSWDEVKSSLQKAVQGIANVIVLLNPYRIAATLLKDNPLTKHAFFELDKFTGGMITTGVNVTDLIARAARGDAISKRELVMDAIFMIQVVSIFLGPEMPAAIGALVGVWVGNEVCKHQTEAVDACKAAFVIVGTAAGSYVGSTTTAAKEAAASAASSSQSGAAFALNPALPISAQRVAERGFTDYLSTAAQTYLEQRLVQEASREAIALCQRQNWLGDTECSILGHIAANYVNAPEGTEWPKFLAEEAARLGVSLMMEEWFPVGSPERNAIHYNEIPGQTIVYDLEGKKKGNPLTFLLLAGGAAFLMMGAS